MPAHKPKASDRARARVQAARALGERKFEHAQTLPWVRYGLQSFEHEQRSGAALLAGGLAYRLFFWLVAFGLAVAAAASFWVRSEGEGSLTHAGKSFGLSGIAARSAASAVHTGSHPRWYFLIAGLVLLIYFGTGGVRALRVAAIIAWRLPPSRLRHPVRASALFTAVFLLGLAITIFASWERHQSVGLGLAVTLAGIAAFTGLALLVFRLLPHPEDIGVMSFLPGAVLVGAGLTAFHVFVVYYLSDKLERSPKLYGVLGASTVVLLGLYLIARLIVSAMFLNATLERRSQADEARASALA